MSEPKFLDPYDDLPQEEKSRVQAWTHPDIHRALIGIRPGAGTITTVINLLLQGLINECKRSGITDYTHADAFERLVLRRAASGGGASDSTPHGDGDKASPRNERGRGKNVRATTKGG